MNTPEEQKVVVTAFISALVEGVRRFGLLGVPESRLYASVSERIDRKAFNLIIEELIEQKTFKRRGAKLVYCGPCMVI